MTAYILFHYFDYGICDTSIHFDMTTTNKALGHDKDQSKIYQSDVKRSLKTVDMKTWSNEQHLCINLLT